MKKISATIIAMLLIVGASFAQNSAVKYKLGKFGEEFTEKTKSGINSKAMKNFSQMFSGATHVIWSHDNDNISRVYFETEGKVTRAGFNQRGQFLYSITTYQEDMLPVDIWVDVKLKYYRKHIFGVSEINTMNKTAYYIILEDATSWMHIKVLDDEITEEKLLLKAE